MIDTDFSGASTSLRSIFKFNNYRNFSLFDRLQYNLSLNIKNF